VIVKRRDGSALRQLRTLYDIGTIGDLTDGQLLERFATEANEVAELAFSALVERHEAMVWRTCVAILRNEHEAEDAFQATFLVLVRKARSLWVRDSLGPWLHQVACRTASCLRTTVNRRRTLDRRCAERNAAQSVEVATSRDPDLDAAVHDEVNRLPQKYRAPIVLCDLEGRTHQEAARFLGWPIGTVKSRQSQGRDLIRDRLVRRGLGLAVAGAIAESLRQTAFAATPKKVSQSTVIAAMRRSARFLPGVEVSADVLSLTQEALRAMLWIRVRFITVATLAVGIASGLAISYVRGSQEPAPQGEQPVSKRSTTTTATSQPKTSKKATGQPATSMPQSMLRAQQLAVRKAKAAYEIAKLTRELAEIAVEEYEEVIYPPELATADGEIKLAESDLSRAADHLAYAKRMFEKNQIMPKPVREELSFQKARFALEQAQSKKMILEQYTKSKTLKELKSEVQRTSSDELAKKATYALEIAIGKKLEREARPKTN
jgi:HlyD family secretion protein